MQGQANGFEATQLRPLIGFAPLVAWGAAVLALFSIHPARMKGAVMIATRVEHDSLGPVNVPADKLWGAQTQRSLEHL